MKQLSSKVQKDMHFGQPLLIPTCPEDDAKGNIDYTLINPNDKTKGLRLALRTRRISFQKWGEVSIRYQRENGAKTEYAKLLDGECQSQLFIFVFSDAYVVCPRSEIIRCLKAGIGKAQDNYDGTWAWYIPLSLLKAWVITEHSSTPVL